MSHGTELFKELLETQQYSDVTLVYDDEYSFKAHKFMLSACSSVFKNILDQNPQNTSIYLRSIQHHELESIMQFIYLGEAKFYQERMNEFLNVAKDLDLKEIGGNIDVDEDPETFSQLDEKFNENSTQAEDETVQLIEPNYQVKSNKSNKTVAMNNKSKFPCQQCDYQATTGGNLQMHVLSIHEGVKYPCEQCDYQATTTSALKIHVQFKHEGIKYPCEQCDYQATTTSNLKRHVETKHI